MVQKLLERGNGKGNGKRKELWNAFIQHDLFNPLSTQTKQIPTQLHGTRARTKHLIPPPLTPQTARILARKPHAQPTNALQHGWQGIPIAFSNRYNALVEAIPLIRICRHGGDEKGPDGIDGCVEGAFYGEREEDCVECLAEFEDGGVVARETVVLWSARVL